MSSITFNTTSWPQSTTGSLFSSAALNTDSTSEEELLLSALEDDNSYDSDLSINSSTLSLDDVWSMMKASSTPPPKPPEDSSVSDSNTADLLSEISDNTTAAGDLGSLDADGDGTLSTDEYEEMIAQMGISNALSSDEFYTLYDTDDDGEITKAEMNAAKPPMGPPPSDVTNDSLEEDDDSALLSALDTNGDGVISAEEYAAAQTDSSTSDAMQILFSQAMQAYETGSYQSALSNSSTMELSI